MLDIKNKKKPFPAGKGFFVTAGYTNFIKYQNKLKYI
jgi:hypothetical protein